MATQLNNAKLNLRLSRPTYERLKAAAESNGRSLNSEIIQRLKNSFEHEDSERSWAWLKDAILQGAGAN